MPTAKLPREACHPEAFALQLLLLTVVSTGAAILVADIQDTRDMLASLSLSKTILVGNSDAGSFFNTEVLSAVDYGVGSLTENLRTS